MRGGGLNGPSRGQWQGSMEGRCSRGMGGFSRGRWGSSVERRCVRVDGTLLRDGGEGKLEGD